MSKRTLGVLCVVASATSAIVAAHLADIGRHANLQGTLTAMAVAFVLAALVLFFLEFVEWS